MINGWARSILIASNEIRANWKKGYLNNRNMNFYNWKLLCYRTVHCINAAILTRAPFISVYFPFSEKISWASIHYMETDMELTKMHTNFIYAYLQNASTNLPQTVNDLHKFSWTFCNRNNRKSEREKNALTHTHTLSQTFFFSPHTRTQKWSEKTETDNWMPCQTFLFR